MEKFDVVVIGAGPGGYPAAIRAAQLGASVAIIEREKPGGTCLNWGCIPTKTLIASSELYHRAAHGEALGVKPGRIGFDYAAMIERKNGVVSKLNTGVSALLTSNGVTYIEGTASFIDPHRLCVQSKNEDTWLKADKVIIATGAASALPGFLPKSKRIMESRSFLDQTALPKSLIVLGGGVIGCEFACMAAQLGCNVTIVEMLDDILMVLDKDVRRVLRKQMEKALGIKIYTGVPLSDIQADQTAVSGNIGDETVEAEALLVAIGRKPCTAELNLAHTGIETDQAGTIAVDDQQRTAMANIFAIGDVTTGSTQLAHAATSEGVLAAEVAVTGTRRRAETIVPACIFTSPEVGTAGISEAEAKANGIAIKTGRFDFMGLSKAMAAGETVGFVKWIADAETGQLLGATAIGAHATELISEAATAIRNQLTAEALGNTIHCHPTFSEAWMEAAHALHGTCVHQPARKKR